MESVEPAAVVADARDLDLVSASGFDGPVLAVPDERLSRARAGGGGRLRGRPPRPDRLHIRHRRRAEADSPRPRLPERSERAGRALVRSASGRAVLVHGRQRLVAVGAQRLPGRLAARCGRAAARRALRPRGAPRAARPGARERPVHVAHRVPRDREALHASAARRAPARLRRRRAAQPRGGARVAGGRGRVGARRLRPDGDRPPDGDADRPAREARVDGQAPARVQRLDRRRRAGGGPRDRAHLLPRRPARSPLAHRRPRAARTTTATSGSRAGPTT